MTTRLNPKKLPLSKWTAVQPVNKEKHFLVVRLLEPDLEGAPVETVEMEAILTRRTFVLPWRALTDEAVWQQGWN